LRAQRAAAPAPSDAPVFYTLRDGLGTLVDALARTLTDADVRIDAPVSGISRIDAGWSVDVPGEVLDVDAVILAVPAFAAAELLAGAAPEAARLLGQIDYSSVALVAMAFPDTAAGRPLDASGYLVPKVEGLLLTACSWSSSKWPHLS